MSESKKIVLNFFKENYLKNVLEKVLTITLSLSVITCSLLFSQGLGNSTQALTEGTWLDLDENGAYKYVDLSPFVDKEAAEYIINNEEQLAGFAALVNNYDCSDDLMITDKNDTKAYTTDFKDKRVILNNNLNLNAHEWVPIGIATIEHEEYEIDLNVFSGTFDAQENVIDYMQIGVNEDFSNKYVCAGLFGEIKNANIYNTKIGANSNIKSSNAADIYAGGIAGYARYYDDYKGEIENCSNEATINCTF